MTIKLVLRKKEFQLEEKSIQVKLAFRLLDLSPEAHLLVRNGELLNENDYLSDGDEVKIVPVISGGAVPALLVLQVTIAHVDQRMADTP
jgi:sulfur carrier protein ThiS